MPKILLVFCLFALPLFPQPATPPVQVDPTVVDKAQPKPPDTTSTPAGTPIGTKSKDCPDARYWVAGLLVVYWFAILSARFHNIATVTRYQLAAEINKVRQRAAALPDGPAKSNANTLVGNADKLLSEAREDWLLTFLSWLRGQEFSAYVQLEAAEKWIIGTYDDDQTFARLQIAAQELRPGYTKVAEMVDAALTAKGDDKPSSGYKKALLAEALDCIYQSREGGYHVIFDWQNKAFNLLFIATLVLLTLIATSRNSILIAMGLAGGLVSRLIRGARGTEIPKDFGATWTSLFMSPIYGAFAGWFGILILQALKDVGVLGDVFHALDWQAICDQPLPLALAFAFGFSERLFTSVTDALEKAVNSKLGRSAADSSGTSGGSGGPVADPPTAAPIDAAQGFKITDAAWVDDHLVLKGSNLDQINNLVLRNKDSGEKVDLTTTVAADAASLTAKAAAKPASGEYQPMFGDTPVGDPVKIP